MACQSGRPGTPAPAPNARGASQAGPRQARLDHPAWQQPQQRVDEPAVERVAVLLQLPNSDSAAANEVSAIRPRGVDQHPGRPGPHQVDVGLGEPPPGSASTALLREAVLFTLSGRKGALARGKRPALTLPHLALIQGAHHEMKTPLLSDREADSADYRALAATGPDRAERIARTMNSVGLGQLHSAGPCRVVALHCARPGPAPAARKLSWDVWPVQEDISPVFYMPARREYESGS